MTGRDIIIYILENHLEDKNIYELIASNLLTFDMAAEKFNVGISTVKTWVQLGMLPCFKIGGVGYILKNAKNPIEIQEDKESSK